MILLVILLPWLWMFLVTTEEEVKEDKVHFRVHNKKQGELEIHATKAKAKILATADSIEMIVNPGKEEFTQSLAPVHHDVNHTICTDYPVYIGDDFKRNILPNHLKKLITKRKFLKRKRKHFLKLKTRKREKTTQTERRMKIKNVSASKKSLVDKEMQVHGQTGALHVHTDHNITTLNSESGKLEVYIKNPERSALHEKSNNHHGNANNHDDVFITTEVTTKVDKKDNLHRHALVHIAEDVTGLKKSIVQSKQKSSH